MRVHTHQRTRAARACADTHTRTHARTHERVIQQRRDEAAGRTRLDSREITFSRSVVQLAARDQIWDGTVTPINTNLAPIGWYARAGSTCRDEHDGEQRDACASRDHNMQCVRVSK